VATHPQTLGGPGPSTDPKQGLLDGLLAASYDGLCILAADGTFVEMNDAFQRITGLRRSQWIGRTLGEMRAAPGTARDSAALRVLNGSYPASTLVNVRGGEMLLVTANPHFDDDGALRHIILNVRNISQLNFLKYQLEQDRSRAKLAEIEAFRCQYLRDRLARAGFGRFVFHSPLMAKIVATITEIATYDFTVLLEGETGVGKGMLARILHALSRRDEGHFHEVNCATLTDEGVEASLFEAARGGTLFLDEVAETPKSVQGRLLKLLDDPAGRALDVRVIAATNQPLRERVRDGRFRIDLLYRLEVIPLYVPPLRERPEDIKALTYSFLDESNHTLGRQVAIASEAMQHLLTLPFPGNVRELKNLVTRLAITCQEREIELHHIAGPPAVAGDAPPRRMRSQLEDVERRILREHAANCGSTYEVAAHLGINQSSVVRKLKKYGIAPPRRAHAPASRGR
jgi:PAS domain S-box-containing protein